MYVCVHCPITSTDILPELGEVESEYSLQCRTCHSNDAIQETNDDVNKLHQKGLNIHLQQLCIYIYIYNS